MNRLSKESSPYLLQHANNPVDWYAWNDEAFEKAREEDKPILVSIGYSACHWCHVMEKESFEDETTARLMNTHFVNIKIDREERPDLDHIYMDAVQTMTGSGGWPLNVFLTPERKPFFGGTYFPPQAGFNRPSWKELLESIATAFREKRNEINAQAENLTDHILRSNDFGPDPAKKTTETIFSKGKIEELFINIMKTADQRDGGFGNAPKFPQTFSIRFLFQHYYYTKKEEALVQACRSLDHMISGGIYDQLGGGFARYSTDERWLVPHFEKMLYDNALIIIAMSEAFQLTKKAHYAFAIEQTIDFIRRELTAPDGGCYSALDADSEGEEGKYYVWTKAEIDQLLGSESEGFCNYYNVTEKGNWEGKNILHLTDPGTVPDAVWSEARQKLLAFRSMRVRPLLDDKILSGWNALMITAYCKAFAATGREEYRLLAIDSMNFLLEHFKGEGIYYYYHSYKEGKAAIPAFLDDYAYIVDALIHLQEISGNGDYLVRAKEITEWVIAHFSEKDSGFFYFTHQDQNDVIIRKKELYDGAVPSGNSVMACNLLYLSIVFDKTDWKQRAWNSCAIVSRLALKYPGSFGIWATAINAITYGIYEIVLSGETLTVPHINFLSNFIPNRVYQSANINSSYFPLLSGKPVKKEPIFFLCREYVCQNPVKELNELIPLLETT